MIKYEDNLAARINGNNLQPLAGAEVRVTDKATGLPAALYQDDELTPIPQPLVTTNTGYFSFKAANGEYLLSFSPGPNSSRFDGFTRDCELYDADDAPSPVSVVLSSLGAEDGAGKVGFKQAGAGAVATTVLAELRKRVNFEQFGADPSGLTDSSAAFAAALTEHDYIEGTPGATYLIAQSVYITSHKRIVGNGATLKGAAGVICFRLTGSHNRISGWEVDANGALYMVLDQGAKNRIHLNEFRGDVGHYYFGATAYHPEVSLNTFDGEGVSRIVTSVVFEDCFASAACDNTFIDIENWCVQVRGASTRYKVNNNTCTATEYTAEVVATAGQTVFNFTLTNACHLAGIQVDDAPFDTGLTFAPTIPAETPTKNFTVTFSAGRSAGEVVKLIAHRAAENIQINGTSSDGTITGNICSGGGDSGILLAGACRRNTVSSNVAENFAYAGISLEGGVCDNTIIGNTISGCGLVTNTATYSSGVLLGGDNNYVGGNTISDTRGTMRFGISLNTYSPEDGTPNKSVKIGANIYVGSFEQKLYMPNQDATKRRASVLLQDGVTTEYQERVNLDSPWTNIPAATEYWTYSLFGSTGAVRDTVVKQGGAASLKTVAGEYVDMVPTGREALADCVVTVNFRAKNNSGSSYLTAFLNIGGSLVGSPGVTITDTAWRWYSLAFPLTSDIDPAAFSLRIGANSGDANFQDISLLITRL